MFKPAFIIYFFLPNSLPPKTESTEYVFQSFLLSPTSNSLISSIKFHFLNTSLDLFCFLHYHYINSNLGHLLDYYDGLLTFPQIYLFLVTVISVLHITVYCPILNIKIQHFGWHYTKAAPFVFLGYL